MSRAKEIWDEMGLPKLNVQMPWHGCSVLGTKSGMKLVTVLQPELFRKWSYFQITVRRGLKT